MARRLESLFIPGPAGRLESLIEEPEEGSPRWAALVCHPDPSHGGTMHNKVVYRIARALRRTGAVVMRFNYRGVHLSEGAFDRGIGEREDARTALAFLRERYPSLPYCLAGFSFGSRIVLRLGCELGDATAILAVGFPARLAESAGLGHCETTRIFLQSTHDEFGPQPDMHRYFHALTEPKKLIWVEARDHFFAGSLDAFEEAVFRAAAASAPAASSIPS